MPANWDWKHLALTLSGLGALLCDYWAQQAKAGEALPFHLSAAGLILAAMVFGYISKQLGGDASMRQPPPPPPSFPTPTATPMAKKAP